MIVNFLSLIMSIFSSLLGITFIVVFHEFGHFLFCKLFKVYTPTFSIGIGKILFSKKIGETNFCLSAGPIGGYVEIATDKGIDGTKGFNQIPYYQKFFIMLGGIIFNFLLTYVIFAGLFFTGIPESGITSYETHQPVVQSVPSDSINAHNLVPNDVITSINDQPIDGNTAILRNEIIKTIKLNKRHIQSTITRNGKSQKILLNLATENASPSLNKNLDIVFEKKAPLSFQNSLIEAYKTTLFCLKSIVFSLKEVVTKRHTKGFVGPVMAVAVSSKSAQKGLSHLLLLLAIISVNLGFMNLLPLPIFDGGQFVIFTIEAITRRQLSEKIREMIGISSWILAIGLLAIFTLRDIWTLFIG